MNEDEKNAIVRDFGMQLMEAMDQVAFNEATHQFRITLSKDGVERTVRIIVVPEDCDDDPDEEITQEIKKEKEAQN